MIFWSWFKPKGGPKFFSIKEAQFSNFFGLQRAFSPFDIVIGPRLKTKGLIDSGSFVRSSVGLVFARILFYFLTK